MATRSRAAAAREAYLALVRAHEKLSGELGALFREHGLTQAQYNVLRILAGGPAQGSSCQHVADHLLNKLPDVTRLLDRLETAGLVKRARSAEDRRVVLTTITAEGRRRLQELQAPVLALHEAQLAHLSPGAVAALEKGLRALLENEGKSSRR